jgi:quercetin dioxygenase-like cupin family protein
MRINRKALCVISFVGIVTASVGLAVATPPIGLVNVLIGRGTSPPFRIHRHDGDREDRDRADGDRDDRDSGSGLDVKLESKNSVDMAVNTNVLAPGGEGGWHSHTGPVAVIVTQGTMTLVDSTDCTPVNVPAGQAFVELGIDTHNVYNRGTGETKWVAFSFIPPGLAGKVDQPAPSHCHPF